MTIEIIAVGGYGEVGKNMTAVKVDEDVVIFDMGLHLPNYIKFSEAEDRESHQGAFRPHDLIRANAVPDPDLLKEWKPKVRAIVISHGHLDHVGAVPYLAGKFKAPVIGSPYTISVLKSIMKDNKQKIPNKLKAVQPNNTYKINKKLSVEFINMQHSIPQTYHLALHTKYGVILHALDFKLDDRPVLGLKPNYNALKRIGKKGVLIALMDSLYAHQHGKMPSESVVKELLRDAMTGVNNKGKAIIVTTFASHIARLKTIIEFGRQLNRKIVFLGRSLARFVQAAEDINLVHFSKQIDMQGKYQRQTRSILRKVEHIGRDKFLLVVTGHQGEPKSTLSKMATGDLPFSFRPGDHVIFSSRVIPAPENIVNRQRIESDLKARGIRIFKDLHASGHGAREDLHEYILLTKPKHLIPVHSEQEKMDAFVDLATALGYKKGQTVHEVFTGQRFVVKQ